MSRFTLPKIQYFIALLCFLLVGVLATVYLQSNPSNNSTTDRQGNDATGHALTQPTDEPLVETGQPDLSATEGPMELATFIEKSNQDRLGQIETIKQLEQEIKELDEIAETSIELLYKRTGTTKEQLNKRIAELLKQ